MADVLPAAAHAQPASVARLRLSAAASAARGDGTDVPLAPRDAALLAWLALEGPTPRTRVARLLWPDSAADAARNALRQRLFQLRRQVGAELVTGQATLALAAGVTHDLDDADSVLSDLDLSLGGEFDPWLAQQRQRRRARTREALAELADMAERARDWPDALAHAAELLALEPLAEDAHRRLMRLHYLGGDRAAALLAFDRCERVLKDEVGARPSAETLALLRTIEAAGSAAAPTPSRAVPAAVLRPPRMIGRDAEATLLEQGWRAGHVVAVTGEAGMGKTRLLQDFAEPRPGVVHAAARPGDTGVPFATLARLLRAAAAAQRGDGDGDGASRALALFDISPPAAPGGVPALRGEAERLVLQRELTQRLRVLPGVQGLLVDDLHFADAASLEMLLALIDDSEGHLHWALAWRAAEAGSPLQALHDALAEQARLQPVALQPLDERSLAALVDSLALPGVDGRTLAPMLRQRTGGNPLFVLETLKLAWTEPGLRDATASTALANLPRPGSVTRLIERRLAQLSPAAMALARCAAVAGTDFSTALAARVLGVPALQLADAWRELEAAQVLRDEAFVHDLLYEATLASVPAPVARLLHGEIAVHLESEGRAAPATLARHWLAAGRPERARPQLERAAHAATQALDAREAGRLWLQLAQLHEAEGAADAAFAAVGQAVQAMRELTTGPELAGAIERLATLARTPRERADAARRRAELQLTRGDITQASAAVAQALELLGADAPAADRADLLNLQGVLLRRDGRLAEARRSLEAALALARGAGDLAADLPGVLNNLGLVLQAQDDHLGAIGLMQESAERQADPATRARVLNNLAISLEERGLVEMAHEQRLAAARAVAGSGGLVELMLAISLGAVARSLCRFREALQHLERAREIGAGQQHFREEDRLRQLGALWCELGRFNLAREALDEAVRAAAGSPDAVLVDVVRARCLLAQPGGGGARGAEVLALLAPAEDVLERSGDRRALRRLWLLKSRALPPVAALPSLQRLLAEPSLTANPGAALPLQARLAQVLLTLGDTAAALRAAERAADWMAAVQPMEMTPAEVWLTLARAAHAAGVPATAGSACARGLAFVREVAERHLDALYRESWLQRNEVNRELAALAARLGG